MPSPKSGRAGSVVSPADVKAASEADEANPGKVLQVKAEQRKTQSGKYGSAKVNPHKPPKGKEEAKNKKNGWIEIELRDKAGKPVPGESYKIVLPDGETVAEGTLDEKGFARVEGFEPGTCTVSFPRLDRRDWKLA
jgi:hypothetical protein